MHAFLGGEKAVAHGNVYVGIVTALTSREVITMRLGARACCLALSLVLLCLWRAFVRVDAHS